MKISPFILLAMLISLTSCDDPAASSKPPATKPAAAEDGISVYFAPQTDPTALISNLIQNAAESIRIQAYSFRSEPIAKSLVAAHKRGVKITVILDDDKADKKSEKGFLAKKGIPTFIDSSHEKAHNKVMLIDDKTIVTGSFNFTEEEESKADNLLVITAKPALMAAYLKNFNDHLAHSKRYD